MRVLAVLDSTCNAAEPGVRAQFISAVTNMVGETSNVSTTCITVDCFDELECKLRQCEPPLLEGERPAAVFLAGVHGTRTHDKDTSTSYVDFAAKSEAPVSMADVVTAVFTVFPQLAILVVGSCYSGAEPDSTWADLRNRNILPHNAVVAGFSGKVQLQEVVTAGNAVVTRLAADYRSRLHFESEFNQSGLLRKRVVDTLGQQILSDVESSVVVWAKEL